MIRSILFAFLAFVVVPVQAQSGRDADAPANRAYPALLLPGKSALIKARQDEQVAEVMVRPGSRVNSGEPMIHFLDAHERVEVKRAQAFVDQAQNDHNRMKRLHTEDQVSDELLEKSATSLMLAEADLELARIRLDELSVRAPFDGIVAERYVDPGASVEIGDPLVRVSELSSLKLEALIPEEMLPEIRGRKQVRVELSNGEKFTVPLDLGPVVVDPASGTFLLQVQVPNPGEKITPGISCKVRFADPA